MLSLDFWGEHKGLLKLYMQKHIKKEFQINIYFCFIEYTKAFDCMDHSKLWKIFKVMGPDAMILVFWMLSFKPTFLLSSFTFIKRLFSSSSLSAIRVVSSAYLRLLIFHPAISISTCVSWGLAYHMMYSAYKLNKQGDNIQAWRTPFPIWNQSVVPCPVLTVASWPAYRLLKRWVRWSGIPISFRIFNSLLWSTQSNVLK